MRTQASALILAIVVTSCSGGGSSSTERDAPPELNQGTALIDTGDGSALLYVLVADSEEQRAAAFDTTSLEDDEGLAFLYFEPTTEPFAMEGRFALSVAFFDVDGEVLDVVDMEACLSDGQPCPTYDPGVTYLGALGVNDGVFDRLGVRAGAVVEIVPGSE